MRREGLQSGWVFLVSGRHRACTRAVDRTGWYKARGLCGRQTSRVLDNASCVYAGCPCHKLETPIRGKRGLHKAKGMGREALRAASE